MSLMAWYPLNGDLLDYSGNNNHLNLAGTIANINLVTDGKIGKAYKTSQVYSGGYMISTNSVNLGKKQSMFAWINITTLCTDSGLNGLIDQHRINSGTVANPSSGMGITAKYLNATDYRVSCSTSNINGGRTYNTYIGNTTLKTNSWYHLGYTYDNTTKELKFYVNGELDNEYILDFDMNVVQDTFRIFGWNGSSSYQGEQKINDVRIYNHVLSKKEIKEISKAKILHYTFDDFAESTTNLWTGALVIYNNYSVPATLTDTGKTYLGQPVYRLGMTVDTAHSSALSNFQTSLVSHGVYGSSILYKANTKYSASIYWKPVNKSDVIVGGTASNIGGWVAQPIESVGDGWFRHAQTRDGSVTTDKTGHVFHSFICPSLQLNETVYIDFCCPQIEANRDYPTPYVLGSRFDTIKDKSGFSNDATLVETNNPKWISNAKIGKGAYYFSENKRIEKQINTPNQITMNCWFNSSVIGSDSYHIPISIDASSFEMSVDSTGQLGIGFIINGSRQIHRTCGYCMDGNWHMLTGTFDGTTIKGYVDGILGGTLQYSGSLNRALSTLRIGKYSSADTYGNKDAYEDDVRIYATALSEEDIKELYQIRMSIGDKGDLFINDIDVPQSKNLVINGFQDFQSNKNFSQFQYNTIEKCLSKSSGAVTANSDTYIPINKDYSYILSGEFKDGVGIPSRYYFGFHCYDKNFNEITHDMVTFYTNTQTTLAQPLNNGSTTVVLTSAVNWQVGTAGTYAHYKCIGFWGNQSVYPQYTYTRVKANYLTVTGNTLTLQSAWSGGTVPAGTPVANMYSGGSYMYVGAANALTTNDWVYKESIPITGWGQNNDINWRYGTEYVRLMFLINREATGTPTTLVKNLKLENTTFNQIVKLDKLDFDLSEKGVLKGKIVSDSSLPVRYIRDYVNGSTANTGNHWVQIQAIDSIGRNLALYRPASSAILTDGHTSTNPYYSGAYAQVDLEMVQDISQIKIWHYWGDGRTYHNTKTEVSVDGVNWIVIFDSKIQGEYAETSNGHTILCKPQSFSISNDGSIYASNIYSF